MGFSLWGRNKDVDYGVPVIPGTLTPLSPYTSQDSLVQLVAQDALGGLLAQQPVVMTKSIALRIPGVKRAHGIVCAMFARIPFYVMADTTRAVHQPSWLTTTHSGVPVYNAHHGLASDWFFYGWGCLAFNAEMTDKIHVPWGMWSVNPDGTIKLDEAVPVEYRARPIIIGYGENGLLADGADTLKQARAIEAAYQDRLDNPIPLTILGVPRDVWERWTDTEKKFYQTQWVEGRRNGGVALKVAEFPVEMPGQTAVDLYETGRNAVRLDIANHTAMPAGLLEGLKQGGSGGTEMHYSSDVGGAHRSELWDFGLPSRFVAAFEARMSMDDVVAPGLSIRADLTGEFAAPNLNTNPTRED
ncbi:hypothetical protein [Microbacterium rhizomatis]|uniref:Phage portal protein n=1 Tax=Microbacterium rhizomatis TaxID=1631477 RepID=A0A5J5IZD5_9MICO|nr:hypothetical protein [Microbacterium rhizomatis]KAA9105011.1 hypothetical protein F6B43_18355 [Microbacterium rhizomatis]